MPVGIVAELRSLILVEEQRTRQSFAGLRQHAALELLRAIDFDFVFAPKWTSEEPDVREYGYNKALGLFVDDWCQASHTGIYPSVKESEDWADSVIQHCGRLGYCEMGLEMVQYGLADLVQLNESTYEFVIPQRFGAETIERYEFDFMRRVVQEMDQEAWRAIAVIRPEMMRKMAPLVYVFERHFPGHETTPEIDEFYTKFGVYWGRLGYGQDSFPGDAMFGGRPFILYRAVVAMLIGFTLKHLDFMTVLADRYPALRRRNLLTIPIDRGPLTSVLSDLLGGSAEEIAEVLSVLTLCGENIARHSSPRARSIPFVRTAEDKLIRSIGGFLTNPWNFLLTELRARYSRDWDREVARREPMFRQQLYDLFPEARFVKVAHSVRIRGARGDIVTDIDAAVYDTSTGRLGLFQLKWQDGFGSSMRMRESRRDNLVEGADAWIDTVNSWLNSSSPAMIQQHFHLPRGTAIEPSECRLFVLGRNFAHFSGVQTSGPAAWGMWPQVLRLVTESGSRDDPIGKLFDDLRRDEPHAKAASLFSESREEYIDISGSKFRFRIANDGVSS